MTEQIYAMIDEKKQPIQSLEQDLPEIVAKLKEQSSGNVGFFRLVKGKQTIVIVYPDVPTVKAENLRREKQGLPKLNFKPEFDDSRVIYLSSGIPTLFNIDRFVCVDVDKDGHLHLVYPQPRLPYTSRKKAPANANEMNLVFPASPAWCRFLGVEIAKGHGK